MSGRSSGSAPGSRRAEGFVDSGDLLEAAAQLDSAESQLKGTQFDDLNDAVDDLADLYKDRHKDG